VMHLEKIEQIIRDHSQLRDSVSLDAWLTSSTLSRFRDLVPHPSSGETTLMDIGCYQPAIGYYVALGWRDIIGIAKEEGECNASHCYVTDNGATARNLILDVETEKIPQPDNSVDAVLMMEVFEHFGLDPMHALIEANRVLKPGGLLVFSTPNAAAFNNLFRIMKGETPYLGMEFSGFSTNRHNRIYDCHELREILRASGFAIEICTSRTYDQNPLPPRGKIFRVLSKISDWWLRFHWHWQIERGDYLCVTARKISAALERYPRLLYLDSSNWADWFRAIGGEAIVKADSARK
jgi:2-polyprenyl-3-methyl-5-hydroxy-6-metoxy-1,4-benzoquinol methylase